MVGTLVFTACSNDEFDGNTNPTYDGESVKTQFAINIPYAKGSTRMTADNTQQSGKPFLGMTGIRLLAFDGVPGAGGTMSSMIPLVDIATGGLTDSHYKLYNDVNVAVGTDNFLFYATAPMGDDATNKFAKGSIESTLDGKTTVSDIKFNLETVDVGDTDGQEDKLLGVLNAVAGVSDWKDGAEVEQDLKDLHTSFISMTAGSANNIRLALQNLYNTVGTWADASDENASKTVATAIRTAITATYGEEQIFTASGSDDGTYTLATTLTYPDNRNLPDGAVKLKYESDKFSYEENANVTGLTSLDVEKVCFPASLYYFVNTGLAASDESQNSWPSSASDWAAEDWTGWDNEVLATTRTIALKNNIQYAVANMALTVECKDLSLKDNGTETAPAKYIRVPNEGFKVTGLLIGGQPSKVDWKFEPVVGESSATFDYTVYDKVSDVYAKTTDGGGTNYTLVLSDTAATAQKVNFAIELENNSTEEFRGKDGIVPVGGKFYLVGQLDPNSKSHTGFTTPHVFASDYQTVVNATISTLANAYNTIPDLRATQMSLGLSVDLEWKAGLTFEVEIGGSGN